MHDNENKREIKFEGDQQENIAFGQDLTSSLPTVAALQRELEQKSRTIDAYAREIEELKEENDSLRKRIGELELDDREHPNDANTDGQKVPQSRYWTAEEHQRYLEAIKKYGDRDVKSIASYVGTRNATQVRTHGQKYNLRLEREKRKHDDSRLDGCGNSPSHDMKPVLSRKKGIQKKKRPLGDSPQPNSPISSKSATIPVIPQFIQQQIAAETKDSVLASLKGWSSEQYNFFIQGLVQFSDEKDINIRCRLIAENYLPIFKAEEIKQCFTVLSNVAKAKEKDEPQDEFANIEARAKADIFGFQNLASNNSPRYNFQSGNNFPSDGYAVYSVAPFQPTDRRLNAPFDGKMIGKKVPEAADLSYPSESWTHRNHNSNGVDVDYHHLEQNPM